jgi:hypothetical protein
MVFPSILLIILAIAKSNGINFGEWVTLLLGFQIFLGAILLSIEEKEK